MKISGYSIPSIIVDKEDVSKEYPLKIKASVTAEGDVFSAERSIVILQDKKGFSSDLVPDVFHKGFQEAINGAMVHIGSKLTEDMKV